MDSAERWLKQNDPEYAKRQAIKKRKDQDRRNFYAQPQNRAYRGLKKFPKDD